MSNFRIGHPDKRNWTLEELIPGGLHPTTKERGPDKWEIVGYYGSPEDLARHLLKRQIELPEGTLQTQLKDLLAEVKAAEARIVEALTKWPAMPLSTRRGVEARQAALVWGEPFPPTTGLDL